MSTIQAEIYDAFIAAGAPEDKARAAAATVATIPTNYPKPEALATKDYIGKKVAELETRLTRQNTVSTRMIIGAIAIATGVLAVVN